jgi:hypothetical protein
MAHYAFLDENNIVTQVIVGKDEGEDGIDWEEFYGAKRTSYNTRGGVHYHSVTGEPSEDQSKAFRKNYAGIGYTYDSIRDAFIPPKNYESWTLDEQTCSWIPPIPKPNDGKYYEWNETTQSWNEVIFDVDDDL